MYKALIIVDQQNDFCEGGSLAISGGMENGRDISEMDKSDYDVIVATLDWHIAPGTHWSTTPDFKDSWPVHCRAASPGADFCWTLDESQIDKTFYKGMYSPGYSGFEGLADFRGMDAFLRGRDIDAVDVVGLALDFCVRATALDAVKLGYKTRVLVPYCRSVSMQGMLGALADFDKAGVESVLRK